MTSVCAAVPGYFSRTRTWPSIAAGNGGVDPNGCGKSSLFALIRGELHQDRGNLVVPPDWEIAHVAQQTPSGERAAIELSSTGIKELRTVQTQLASAKEQRDGLRQARLAWKPGNDRRLRRREPCRPAAAQARLHARQGAVAGGQLLHPPAT